MGPFQSSSSSVPFLRTPLHLPVLFFASFQSWSSLLLLLVFIGCSGVRFCSWGCYCSCGSGCCSTFVSSFCILSAFSACCGSGCSFQASSAFFHMLRLRLLLSLLVRFLLSSLMRVLRMRFLVVRLLCFPAFMNDSYHTGFRRLLSFIIGLFPQAAGPLSVSPPPRAVFEVFFAPASVPPQPVCLAPFCVTILVSMVLLSRSDLRFPL